MAELIVRAANMNLNTYNAFILSVATGVLVALVIAAISFVAMIVRWNSPKRRGHVIRLALALAAVPCLIGIQAAFLWLVFWPALGREQMANINADRAARLAASSFVHVGDLAPEFSVTDADGDTFSLAGARGKVVLINIFATWCGPCQMELPHFEQIWTRHRRNENFEALVIGREETMDSVRDFRAKNGFSFPIAPDPESKVYALFAEKYIPRTLVVSADGVIVYSQMGFYEADLEELETVLSEQMASLPNKPRS